jgi:radical SAM protein with 4Fe4S-binding SPASM domain
MPNLMLTSRCNFRCSYCFGMDVMGNRRPAVDMDVDLFFHLVEWLGKASFNGNTVHFMGGEPTLHEQFAQMAETVVANRFDTAVFSNVSTANAPVCAERLVRLPIRWIVNVNPPGSRTSTQEGHLRDTLHILGEKASLTFNVVPEQQSFDWVIDLIYEYKLKKKVKVGFLLPTFNATNRHLAADEYPVVAGRVVEFARFCDAFSVSLDYECGIPWCAFTHRQLGDLWQTNSKFFSSCNSILDILPDGRIVYCLPLATVRAESYSRFGTYSEAKRWYESQFTPYRPLGSTSKCFSCQLLISGHCAGGCLARILKGAKGGIIDEQALSSGG